MSSQRKLAWCGILAVLKQPLPMVSVESLSLFLTELYIINHSLFSATQERLTKNVLALKR